MSPPITEFVDVKVSLAGAAATKFSFGSLMGAFQHSVTAHRIDGPYASVGELNDAGFTSVAAPEVNAWATAAFSQNTGVDKVLIGRKDAGDATWTATLDDIEAVAGDDAWYNTNIESRVKADILLAAAWTEARRKIMIAQSSDADVLTGTAGNIALALQAAGYTRTAYIWHAIDDSDDGNAPAEGYLDGAWSSRGGGFNLDAPLGAGVWAFKQLSGVPFDKFSIAQATQVWNAGANLFGRLKGMSFTSKGTMAGGRFIDITTSLDWLKTRLEENILSAFVGAPEKIPYTSAGMNIVRAAAQEIFDKGVSFGHLADDKSKAPILTIPRIEEVSQDDKITRLLTTTANCVLSGGIQKAVFKITVQQ